MLCQVELLCKCLATYFTHKAHIDCSHDMLLAFLGWLGSLCCLDSTFTFHLAPGGDSSHFAFCSDFGFVFSALVLCHIDIDIFFSFGFPFCFPGGGGSCLCTVTEGVSFAVECCASICAWLLNTWCLNFELCDGGYTNGQQFTQCI